MSNLVIPAELIAPIFNPATFANRDAAHRILARLRREYPLSIAEVPGYDPYWIVTRYKDLREIARQDDLFHSGDRPKILAPRVAEEMMRDHSGGPYVFHTLINMDEPEHTAHRNVIKNTFTPQSINQLETRIRATARKYVDHLAALGPACDFSADIASRFPVEIIFDLMGIPAEDHAMMVRLTHWFFNYADPDLKREGADPMDPAQQVTTWKMAYAEFKDYYEKVIQDRRACPRDDFSTVIANGRIDGCPMSDRTTISYFMTLSTAGHDTTAATTAVTMSALAENPGLLARMKNEPALIRSFIEESIRWASPAQHFIRSAAQDYEISGRRIAKGDLVYLSYLSGNRDEDEFADPFTFKPDRTPNRHIGLGYGGHTCVGQHLARLEMRCFWEELLPRLDSVEMTGPVKWQQADFVCGPKSVPIRFSMH